VSVSLSIVDISVAILIYRELALTIATLLWHDNRCEWTACVRHPPMIPRCCGSVTIGFSPLLAYCAIFIVMSRVVVDCTIVCTCVRIGCTPQLRSRRPAGAAPLTVLIRLFCLLAGD